MTGAPARPAGAGTSVGARFPQWPRRVLVPAIVVAGIALRAWILATPLGRPDADEAVVGFMAKAMRDGALPVFFWGQNHGGTAEPGLVALLFTFGASTLTLKLAPILLAALTALLVWRVGRRLLGEPAAGLAGALFLVYPPAYVWWSTKERGFYWAGAVLSVAVLLQAVRVAQGPGGDGDPPPVLATRAWTGPLGVGALGLLAGLAWWTSPQTMYAVLPVLGWFAWRRRGTWRTWWPAIPGGLVGASPWLVWNLAHGWDSLQEATPAVASTYPERLRGFFTELLPEVLGLRVPVAGDWLAGPAGVVLYVAALAGFGALVARAVRDAGYRQRVEPLLVVAGCYPFLFALPGASVFTGEPRYGLMLAPVVVLLLASALTVTRLQAAAALVGMVLASTTVAALVDYAERHPHSVDLAPADLTPLETALDELGIDRLYGDYWVAYPLSFESGEDLVATPVDFVRVTRLHQLVDAEVPSAYVLFGDTARDAAFGARLDELGVGYRRVEAGEFAVFALEAYLQPADVEDVWLQPGL